MIDKRVVGLAFVVLVGLSAAVSLAIWMLGIWGGLIVSNIHQ